MAVNHYIAWLNCKKVSSTLFVFPNTTMIVILDPQQTESLPCEVEISLGNAVYYATRHFGDSSCKNFEFKFRDEELIEDSNFSMKVEVRIVWLNNRTERICTVLY